MNSLLRKIETDDVVIYTEQVYSVSILDQCRKIHKKLVIEGKIEGDFNSDKWIGYSGVRKFGIDFSLNKSLYAKHVGKEFGITVDTMKNMLRCYAIYCHGTYIYQTIAQEKIGIIKEFLMKYRDKDFKLTTTGITTLEDFLGFIGTPDIQIEQIISNIRTLKNIGNTQRKLSPIINYLVIENEIDRIYKNGCDEETFKRWFPIYFWVNITFILPLRATEMLLTPKNCIFQKDDKIFLKIRRTKLKKGTRTVYYDVNKDYKEFVYEIPKTDVSRNIKKYIDLTANQDRRFLFEYSDLMINEMLSLKAFNYLVELFVKENLIGNSRYDFIRYATGITEFEAVTAGDSRPIAMANLYFQKAGEDICRQLANHVNINTSSGYYTNITETIWASSIVQLQKKLENNWNTSNDIYNSNTSIVIDNGDSVCLSPKRMVNEENLDDCIEQNHLADCIGCKFYRPTKKELELFMISQKEKADKSAKAVIDFMNNTMKLKKQDKTLEEIFLEVQTNATRYRMGCNVKAEEKLGEWQKLKNIQKTYY